MIRLATRFCPAPRRSAVIAALLAALSALTGVDAASESPAPAIRTIAIGVKNYFKVGNWTEVRIESDGVGRVEHARAQVVVPDSDGVPTTASAPLEAGAGVDGSRTAVVYTKVGRVNCTIRISLTDGDRVLDERTIQLNSKSQASPAPVALPATAELLVSLGSAPFGLKEAFPDREPDAVQLARRVIEVNKSDELPTEWFGYESVDVLVLATGDGQLGRTLAADAQRLAALSRWVELGGRLVILCSSQSANELFAEASPLARFAPGKLAEVVRLPETSALEHFAGSSAPIAPAPGTAVRVPRFTDVRGKIEAYTGRKPIDLPLVVRSPYGLGEVAFVGLEFHSPPLADWSGRSMFLQSLLRPYLANIGAADGNQRLVTRGYNDLSGALRQQLGRSFASVVPIGFAVVAVLALAYIAFLGPLDYLLVNRWLRRPWIAWVTFPLIVATFSAAALSLAEWRKGSAQPRLNRLNLVDVDMDTGRARGTFWGSLYCPAASQLDLSLNTPSNHAATNTGAETLLSWWGLPGVGIGGMHAGGIDLGLVRNGYRYGPQRNSLEGVPILAASTKALVARWTSSNSLKFDADLSDVDGLAVGSITNLSGMKLRNVRLLYGTWAYKLGTLNVGQRIEVGEQLNPRKVKTIVTHDVLSGDAASNAPMEGRVFQADEASPKQILSLMMFYDAAGGFGFAHLPNRFQAYCDLSRLLELGRAIVVADADEAAAQLVDDATKRAIGDEEDESRVVYRFVLPVKRSENSR